MGDFVPPDSIEGSKEKTPFRLLNFAVKQVLEVAIPLHLQTLKEQCSSIEKYRNVQDWVSMHSEQVKASNTVRLLKSDIYELECLNAKVREEDRELFLKAVQSPIREVVDALAVFAASNSNVMLPLPNFDEDHIAEFENIPQLVCNPEQAVDECCDSIESESSPLTQVQIQKKPLKVVKHWQKLVKDIAELNELFKTFANSVFSQKGSVDTIENHVQQAHDNVIAGTKHLKKAVVLQAAILPFAGAAIGGLLGPVGAAVGFHVFGSLACALGGSAVGFGVGCKLKRSRIASCDSNMKAINASTQRLTQSTPDLLLNSDDIQNPSTSKECKKDS